DGDEVDVLLDAVVGEEGAGRAKSAVVGEDVGAIAHEQVVVLDGGRPVRGEAELDAGADRATPAGGVADAGDNHVGAGEVAAEAVIGDRSTTLHVEQHVVEGVADLAGEEAERTDVRFIVESGCNDAAVAAPEVGPVALAFDAEHPGACLPAIAELTA